MLRLSKGNRAEGIVKSRAEDFIVEEITSKGFVLEKGRTYTPEMLGLEEQDGNFSIFVMQKTNWNTAQALKTIAKRFRRGIKSTGFAGTKDRISVSTQLCSIFGVRPDGLPKIHVKDVSINGAWSGTGKVEMGDLLGNRFGITARSISDCEGINTIDSELGGLFPNYFGEQRFGYRDINVQVGADILKGDFKGAAMRFLTETQKEANEEAKYAREKLAGELDFKDALKYFPVHLKYERSMIEYLAKYPNNYANAIRKLPRSISLMFIHSVESYIFNRVLDERIEKETIKPRKGDLVCLENDFGFPDMQTVTEFGGKTEGGKRQFLVGNITGYDTKSVNETEQLVLDELGIGKESFNVRGLTELNSRGTYRTLFAPYKDMSFSYDEDEKVLKLGFSLPAGSYATVLLNELIESR